MNVNIFDDAKLFGEIFSLTFIKFGWNGTKFYWNLKTLLFMKSQEKNIQNNSKPLLVIALMRWLV